jgi:phosphotransacetylase
MSGCRKNRESETFSTAHLSEDGLHVDGQVTVGAAVAPHDAEAQAVGSPVQGDGLVLRGAARKRTAWSERTEV